MLHTREINIPEFYAGKSAFVTGATGFVGKVLLQKLLISCPGLKNVYLLMREKRGKNSRQRFEELFNSKVFDVLKEQTPDAVNKVIEIPGDLTLPELGISQKNLSMMMKSPLIVFHVGATIKFDEPLKQAVDTNVLGTCKMVELCHKLGNVEVFIYVSTAYSNSYRSEIEEIVYKSHVSPQQIIDITRWMSQELLYSITPKIIGEHPNVYTFTKSLMENLLVERRGDLPVAIVRPSIIVGAWKEPCPGWIDSFDGAAGLTVAISKGFLRTMLAYNDNLQDFIPVDVLVNMLIVTAWYTALHRSNEVPVYNCTSYFFNKITLGEVLELTKQNAVKYPSSQLYCYPDCIFRKSLLISRTVAVLKHYMPAMLADVVAIMLLKKPRFMRLNGKMLKYVHSFEYFSTREWKFKSDNVVKLDKILSNADKEIFNFNISELNWTDFWENQVLGYRKFLFKENCATLPAARKNLRKKYIFTKLIDLFMIFIIVIGLLAVWTIFVSSYSFFKNL